MALLHELGAPASLNVLIDGEAMLNDGSASVVFFVFRDFARGDRRNVGEVVEQISRLTFASIGIGLAFAVGLIAFIFLQQNEPTHEIMSTIGVAWITFWVAEGSGVQAWVHWMLSCIGTSLWDHPFPANTEQIHIFSDFSQLLV